MKELPVLLDRLELAAGPALAALRSTVGLAPDQILAAPEDVLRSIVAGARPAERARRLRQCAELAVAGAPWRAYPGIGPPGTDRIDLFTGTRAVLALDANGLRVLARLGFGDPARSYAASYRQAQLLASEQLPAMVPACQRACQLLRRHGQVVCRRKDPSCSSCPISGDCPSAGHPPPLY